MHVQYATQRTGVPNVAEFRRCVVAALCGRVDGGEVLVRVVDDAESAELNRQLSRQNRADQRVVVSV